jgi:hypothetical protein
MLNTTGVLAVLDRGLTLNWEDGPTLHRMTAQVRYHTASAATVQLLRVLATQRQEDNPDQPFTFAHEDGTIRVVWTWQAHGEAAADIEAAHTADRSPYGWTAQLSVTNKSDEDILLDTLDVIRIDAAYSGQFNLGAPPGLWQCARESSRNKFTWEAWPASTAGSSAGGFTRSDELLVQPSVSNRSRPPAVLIRVVLPSDLPAEIKLDMNGERFERMVARNRADGALLKPGDTLTSATFALASGDDAMELRKLVIGDE